MKYRHNVIENIYKEYENKIVCKDNKHYLINSNGEYQKLWSPSFLFSDFSKAKYENIPQWILERAAEVGKQIHSYIEARLANVESEANTIADQLTTNNLKNADYALLQLQMRNWMFLGSEVPVWNEIKNTFGYVDLLFYDKATETYHIVEVKTRSKLENIGSYFIELAQVQIYKDCFDRMRRTFLKMNRSNIKVQCWLMVIDKKKPQNLIFECLDNLGSVNNMRLNNFIELNLGKAAINKDIEKEVEWIAQIGL